MDRMKAAIAALISACVLCPLHSHADPGRTSVVYPTGAYPDDVNRVQLALDGGGTVLLKAVNAAGIPTAFNFGTSAAAGQSGTVFLNKDVSIVGEVVRLHRTTILGGFNTITCTQPVKSTITGLDFESPIWDAIVMGESAGSVITDNIFHNVVPVRVRVPSGNIITFAEAIGFSAYDASGPAPQLISGKVVVARNTIDGARALFSNGIQFDSFSADVEIADNYISNVNDDTTETGSGIAIIRAENNVRLTNNVIVPGPTQNVGADGIFIGGDRGARYQVVGNSIWLDGQISDGIDVAGGDATSNTGTVKALVANNSVVVPNGLYAYGIFIFDLVSETQVVGNSIVGAGYFGIGVSTYGFDTNVASHNRFVGNDLRKFTSSQADLFYDSNAQYNVEVGFCRSAIDLGTGNFSTCGPKMVSGAQGIAPSFLTLASKRGQLHAIQTLGRIARDQVVR